jgi:sulfide:quinone oxidoreductase
MLATGSKQIVIVGAGFGGLTAARRLRKLMPSAEITMVTPVDEFQYLPSLIWIPTGLRDGAELRFSLTPLLAKLRVRLVEALATGLDPAGRVLHTTKGDIAYDG